MPLYRIRLLSPSFLLTAIATTIVFGPGNFLAAELAGVSQPGFDEPESFGAREPETADPTAADVSPDDEAASKYSADMAKLDNQALLDLAALDGDLATQIDDLTMALDEALFSQISGVEFVNIVVDELEAVESPYTESFLEAAHSERLLTQIKRELSQLAEGELPEPARLSIPPKWEPPAGAEDAVKTLADAARGESRRVKRQQAEANRLLDFFKRLDEKWKNYLDLLEHRNSATTDYADKLGQVIVLELKRLAAVREIEKRIDDGKLAADQVPQDVLGSADPDLILDLFETRRTFQADLKSQKQQDERTRQRVEMSLLWQAWGDILSLNVDSRVPLADQAVAHLSAGTVTREQLEEFERRSIEFRSEEAHKAATTRSDTFLAMLLGAEGRERFESGLAFYYLELEDANRRIGEYQAAAKSYQELVDTSAQLRNALAGSPDDLNTALSVWFAEFTRARFMAAIAAHPEGQQQYVDQYAQLGQDEFPLPLDDQPGDVDYWANQLLVAQARWLGQMRWLDDIEFLLSRLGVVADVARLREHAAEIQLQLAATEARAKNVQQLIASLTSDYRKRMKSNALNNLTQLLAIPVVALILSFFVRRFCVRLERTKADESSGNADRSRRLGTLARTASGALNALIWFLAAIYMLRLTGLDITPIVASASVLGLAIAFASQALIKDFFTGFVMLWENQYAVGDWIAVGGVEGEVERVSLRVTVLRDFEGRAHFIPNGSVSQVSNHTNKWSSAYMMVRVPYDVDVDHVMKILKELLDDLQHDPEWAPRLQVDERENDWESPAVLGAMNFTDEAVEIGLFVKTERYWQWIVGREIRRRIKLRFETEGIQIPFDARFRTQPPPDVKKLPADQSSPTNAGGDRTDSDEDADESSHKEAREPSDSGPGGNP